MIKKIICPLLFLVCLLISCKDKKIIKQEESNLEYATRFNINRKDTYTELIVYNPWQGGEILKRYYLVKDAMTLVPEDGIKVKIPVSEIVVNSATYLGFINELKELSRIVGVCNSNYIYSPYILDRIEKGEVLDLGDSFNLDIEKLLLLQPDLIMTPAYSSDEQSKKLQDLGIPVVYNLEWQESSLLGRAEWIKFIGAFFDKDSLATAIFNSVVTAYSESKKILEGVKESPKVMIGQDYRGTWTMPTGKSFNGQLLKDAKANYFYVNDTLHTGSISTTIEEALINFHDAQYWFYAQANSKRELIDTDKKYKLFYAYQSDNIYNTNQRANSLGGNDYWEEGVIRPDFILKDIIKVLHPEKLPDYQLRYFKKLEE